MAPSATKPAVPSAVTKMMWFKAPPAIYFGWGGTAEALRDLDEARIRRVFIVTDRNVSRKGYPKVVTERLDELEIDHEIYADVTSPTAAAAALVVKHMQLFRPDCIIAIGGGSVMDIAKVCRIIYDPSNSHTKLDDLFAYDHTQLLSESEEKTGVSRLPRCDSHIRKLVCIPTTSGTGGEMTPIAWVIEEESTGTKFAIKRPIVTWRMTPDIAINDGFFTTGLSESLAAGGGLNAFGCAMESAVSRLATDYTYALSIRAVRLLYDNLQESVNQATENSRSHCHNAASIAGMAAANAFVGVAHALSFVLQRFFSLRPGRVMSQGHTTALVLSQVIRFNATRSAEAARKYADIADQLGVVDSNEWESLKSEKAHQFKVGKLIHSFQMLKSQLAVDMSIKACGVDEEEFEKHLDILAAETLNVVGCTATNPVDVTVEDAKHLLECAFSGNTSDC